MALSLRRLWTIYKRTALAQGTGSSRRDLAQVAFYSGARGVLRVLDHMIAGGDYEGLHRVIQRHGRQIRAIQGLRYRTRRH
jgi:alkylated DNA nucleotide flippase Atl1